MFLTNSAFVGKIFLNNVGVHTLNEHYKEQARRKEFQ
jgi:hypothetical protein